jgi:hypothetical protein
MINLKILFLITSSKTHNHNNQFTIDRVDLTRKMDVINTWGQDALSLGHDIIFFEGDSEIEYYDDNTKTLYLQEDDSYEVGGISPLFNKAQKAYDWVIKNKEFDVVYNCDDDVFVNLPEFLKLDLSYDFISHGSLGGGGFIFSKKSLEIISKSNDVNYKNADSAIYNIIIDNSSEYNLRINTHNIYCYPFYFPGELYATIHYVSGKRAYFLHNILKYYHENGYTNRKILLGGLLDSQKRNDIVSYESTVNRKSPRWYDFTIDYNNWEYHGGYIRSNISFNNLKDFWPYAKNSTKYFVINFNYILSDYINTDLFIPNLTYLIERCEESLIDKNNLFLLSEKNESIDGWIIDSDIKKTFKLDFELLNNCNFYKKNK